MLSNQLYYARKEEQSLAESWAEKLGFETNFVEAEPEGLWLKYEAGVLSLNLLQASVCVDFLNHYKKLKASRGFAKKSLLAKALGVRPSIEKLVVLDATAGLGRDSLLISGLGCRVLACERNPVLFEMLENGRQRLGQCEELLSFLGRVEWLHIDSLELLSNDKRERPDVIYLDPMYPEKKKSALPKKEMQILQRLTGGESEDGVFLLEKSLSWAKQRVVVKRPPSATPLAGHPQYSYQGKSVRYDVYPVEVR